MVQLKFPTFVVILVALNVLTPANSFVVKMSKNETEVGEAKFRTEKRTSPPKNSKHVAPDEWALARNTSLESFTKGKENHVILPTETVDAKFVEGDMTSVPISSDGRAALMDRDMKWPLNTVYYIITGPFSLDERTTIIKAMDVIQQNTCIRFVGRTNQPDYINYVKKTGCYSAVGRQGGMQELSLGDGCLTIGPGIAMHETMHALGFFHEQSRPDRDNFVTIVWDNILEATKSNFDSYPPDYVDTQGIPYDYGSIMHYGKNAFIDVRKAGPNADTIEPKDPNAVIGQRIMLSDNDIRRIRTYYQCDGTASQGARPDVCANNHESCPDWTEAGECDKNPAWMLRNCQDSCNICSARGGCIDEDKNCPTWAAKGECDNNPGFMLMTCRLSCKNCNPKWAPRSGACLDSNSNCSRWSRAGQCTKNPAYMMQICKRSCNNCK